MLIYRYLLKELTTLLVPITLTALFILLSNQFSKFVENTARGKFPINMIMQLMMLELPKLLSLMLPLSFYFAVFITYSRLYSDNEMMVLSAAGFSQKKLYVYTFSFAFIIAVAISFLTFVINPILYSAKTKLLKDKGIFFLIHTLNKKTFTKTNNSQAVIYVDNISKSHNNLKNIFYAEKINDSNHDRWKITRAKNANLNFDNIIVNNGESYELEPGQLELKKYFFDRMQINSQNNNYDLNNDVQSLTFNKLLTLKKTSYLSELHWRLGPPIMVLTLSLLALPLSQSRVVKNQSSRFIPALLIYFIYAVFMVIGRKWLIKGIIPSYMGLWWAHGVVILLSLFLIYKQKLK